MNRLTVTGHFTGRHPTVAPNPNYPDGMDVDMAPGRPGCITALEHPAPSIGHWLVECSVCGLSVIITAAGRPDDPRNVRVPCKPN